MALIEDAGSGECIHRTWNEMQRDNPSTSNLAGGCLAAVFVGETLTGTRFQTSTHSGLATASVGN